MDFAFFTRDKRFIVRKRTAQNLRNKRTVKKMNEELKDNRIVDDDPPDSRRVIS